MRAAGTLKRRGARNTGGGGTAVETEVLGPYRQSDCAYHATATAPCQARTRSGCGRRSLTLESTGAAHRSSAQHAWEGTHGQRLQRHLPYVARFAACDGISRTTRQRCGAGGRAGAKVWRYGRTRGCKLCSKSARKRLVRMSVQRLAHGRTHLAVTSQSTSTKRKE